MSLVIDVIDLVTKHKSGELRCPATALIFVAGIRPHTSALKLGCYARLKGFKIKF